MRKARFSERHTKMIESLRGGLISIKGLARMNCEVLGPSSKEFLAWKKVSDWAEAALKEAQDLELSKRTNREPKAQT